MEPSPLPDPAKQVTPGDGSGPVRITFLQATPAAGSTISGCGSLIGGCAGRLRIDLQLSPPTSGPVLYVRVYLHATNLVACLWGETGPFDLQGGVARTIAVLADSADACGTPTTIASMAAVVEGPVQVASRQAWSLHYEFVP